MKTLLQQAAERWFNPYKRYRYSRLIHAVRLGLAVLCATLIARRFGLMHGEWISITVFVVLGMLQFQGAIYSKAVERMLGTLIGLAAGLLILWLNQNHLHDNAAFYLILGAFSAVAGWLAVGKNGYIPMLAGLTMCMLAGGFHSGEWLHDSMMRALNVLLGAAIAVAAAKLMPLKSTLMWRFLLADNLTAASRVLAEIGNGEYMGRQRWRENQKKIKQINNRLVRSRSHLTPTAQESRISLTMMETIQHTHRKIVSSTDLLLHAVLKLPRPDISEEEEALLNRHFAALQHELHLTSHMLKGRYAHRIHISTAIDPQLRALSQRLPFEWQGFIWLSINIRIELANLVMMLVRTRQKWLEPKELRKLRKHLIDKGAHGQGYSEFNHFGTRQQAAGSTGSTTRRSNAVTE
ncbi:FUSC family protein [Neisseria dentiae]|nr:FUSC family protein [Neisseria dentiae]